MKAPIFKAGRPSQAANKTRLLDSLADKPALVRVNVQVTPEQHARLKVFAAKRGTTVRDVLASYIDSLPAD